jgi:AsmA protein
VWLRVVWWTGAALLGTVLLAVLAIALLGWNWLRGPMERLALQQTGRVLAIHGDLTVTFGWPQARLRAATVTFANPAWASEKQMVSAAGVEVAIDLPQLLQRRLAFPEVRLDQAAVFLEKSADGRKSWLLDLAQQDENARIPIGRVALDHGTLGYDDTAQHTRLRAEVSTQPGAQEGRTMSDLRFTVQGHYKGLALQANGRGGPVLALRDTRQPYPLRLDATLGRTGVRVEGSITSLLALSAVDLRMAVRGDSLEQLYPLLGMAFPATHAYAIEGHLVHAGSTWRYEKFSGRVGTSDLAGEVQVVTGGKRPVLTADVTSRLLALDDLGPVIGARPGSVALAAKQPPAQARVLPDLPFHTDRWDSVDAEVQLRAQTLRRAQALPLENLVVHLSLRDAVLTLDPLSFGLAGGALDARITLDGRTRPIQAHARVRVRKVALGKLFPKADPGRGSIGQLDGDFDLTGRGNSVGAMLAGASGKLGLVVAGGQISRLMMEKAGLHLWEILSLNLTGDRLVKLRCAVADFDVQQGKMRARALVFDTEVTTLIGSGRIDLAHETLDLTFNPKTKNTSPVALRSPIYVRGSFARPTLEVDRSRVALRAVSALTLGLINPLLALLPLVDAGPGQDSDCARLVREAPVGPNAGKSPK